MNLQSMIRLANSQNDWRNVMRRLEKHFEQMDTRLKSALKHPNDIEYEFDVVAEMTAQMKEQISEGLRLQIDDDKLIDELNEIQRNLDNT